MKAAILLLVLLMATVPAIAQLGKAREFLTRNNPQKAEEIITELLSKTPDDPWLLYNAGVVAYAAKNYAKADALWQRLAGMEVPEQLRVLVWMQIGNASFRMAEAQLDSRPDVAVGRLEQSREAYRIALAQNSPGTPASNNLLFTEKQLETLYVRLAARLLSEATREKAHELAIRKLHAALENQRNATAFHPEDPRHIKAERDITQMLARRYMDKAGEEESKGEQIAGQKVLDESKRDAARQDFEKAIVDFKQAQAFDPDLVEEAKRGEQRVIGKLADMLAKIGRQEQRTGNAAAKQSVAQALENYGKALNHFDDALKVMADHQDARAGREEVKQAMEKLHLQQGDRLTREGEAQLKIDPADATGSLLGALDHFEQAKTLNPQNPEIPPRIEHVKRLLPKALVAIGKREQQSAKEDEPKSVPDAIIHLEQAEAAYVKALQFDPANHDATKGMQEVRDDLARLRKPTTQSVPQAPPEQKEQENKQEQADFETMLAKLKANQKQHDSILKRRVVEKYDPASASTFRNW